MLPNPLYILFIHDTQVFIPVRRIESRSYLWEISVRLFCLIVFFVSIYAPRKSYHGKKK